MPVRSCTASIGAVSIVLTFGLIWHVAPRQIDSNKGFQSVGELTVLEPENWTGKEFPLLEYIDLDVSQGNWVLLLHRHNCPKCQEVVPRYQSLAKLGILDNVALVEVPPHDSTLEYQESPCLNALLSNRRNWYIQTPIEIQLSNGIVKNASTDLPSLDKIRVAKIALRINYLQTTVASGCNPEHYGGTL